MYLNVYTLTREITEVKDFCLNILFNFAILVGMDNSNISCRIPFTVMRRAGCFVWLCLVVINFILIMKLDTLHERNNRRFKGLYKLEKEKRLKLGNTTFLDRKANEENGLSHSSHTSVMKNEKLAPDFIKESNGSNSVSSETKGQGKEIKHGLPEQHRKPVTLKPRTNDDLPGSQPVYVASYVMENENLCSSVENLSAVIIVHTAPGNLKIRNAIRDTWANNSYYSHLGTVRILFLLGLVSSARVQNQLKLEFSQHGDLLQGDFVDNYHNLTLKGVMAYKWLTEKCRNAKIVIKTDDDVVVNMMEVLTNITSFTDRQISCIILRSSKIHREPASRWYIEDKYFSGSKFYPPYCRGPFVVFANDVIPDLYLSSLVPPFFWVDDVYLYGLVFRNVQGVTFNNIVWGSRVVRMSSCLSRQSCPYIVVFLNSRNTQKMYNVWKIMLNSYESD